MTDRIIISGIRAFGRHGFGYELEHEQPFEVDAEIFLDLAAAASADDLGKTVDYGLAAQEVRRTIETESFSLIESLAETVAGRLLAFGATGARVRVSKPRAALTLGVAGVAAEVERWAR